MLVEKERAMSKLDYVNKKTFDAPQISSDTRCKKKHGHAVVASDASPKAVENERLRSELAAVKDLHASTEALNSKLYKQLNTLQRERDVLAKTNKDLESKAGSNERFEVVKMEYEATVDKYNKLAKEVNTKHLANAYKVESLEKEVEKHKASASEMQKEVSQHKAKAMKADSLEKEVEKHKARASDMEKQVSQHKARANDMEKQVSQHKAKNADLETKVKSLTDGVEKACTALKMCVAYHNTQGDKELGLVLAETHDSLTDYIQ